MLVKSRSAYAKWRMPATLTLVFTRQPQGAPTQALRSGQARAALQPGGLCCSIDPGSNHWSLGAAHDAAILHVT
jgi:hypothetical protein